MNGIKNIIFDLGGVIINLDYKRTRNAFIELGLTEFDAIYSQAQQGGFFDSFDKGLLSPEEFRTEIRKHLKQKISDEQIDEAWDAMLLDVPSEKLELLRQLKTKYRTFLLSNTNVIHVRNFSAYLQRTYGHSDFTPYFEQWYYSCNIGMRKPDAEIFEYVLNENRLLAEETLFIDDSIQHIEGAARCGLQTLHLRPTDSLETSLRQLVPF